MKFEKQAIKRSCLLSVLVAGMAMPMISFGQDNSTQQSQSSNNQSQQTDAQNNQSQQSASQNGENRQGESQSNQNQQTAGQNNQNQQGASQRNQNQQANSGNSSQNQQSSSDSQNKQGVDLSNYSDGSFVSLRGTVESVSPNTFLLSYNNDETVTVEMDDGDNDADAYVLLPGDKVTVTGLLDRDLFESRKIEAGSVYVEKLNTYFMSSALDEEDYPLFATLVAVIPSSSSGSNSSGESSSGSSSNSSSNSSSSNSSASASSSNASAADGSSSNGSSSTNSSTSGSSSASENMPVVWLQGKVSSVSDNSLELAMGNGNDDISVSVEKMSNNPLNNENGKNIAEGDIVQVSGQVDKDFFESQQLDAISISKIHDKENIN